MEIESTEDAVSLCVCSSLYDSCMASVLDLHVSVFDLGEFGA